MDAEGFLAFCAARLHILITCVDPVYVYMIATHFHDIPYIQLGVPSIQGGRAPGGPVPTPPAPHLAGDS